MVAPIVAPDSRMGRPIVGSVSPAAAASTLVATAQVKRAQPASCFDAEALNKFCRRSLHLFGEDAGEIARTHRYPFCQQRYGERFL